MAALRGRVLAAYVVLSVLWSGNWLVIRKGLADVPPFLFAGMRLLLACGLLGAIVLSRRREPVAWRQARFIALVGLLQVGVSYACVYTALQWINSGLAAVLFSTFALWVVVLAHVLLKDEPFAPQAAAGALLGVAGVAVIQGPTVAAALSGRPGPLAAGGLLMIASPMFSACAVVLIKKHLAGVPAFTNVLGQSAVGAFFLLALSAGFERGAAVRFTPAALAAVVYLGTAGALIFAGTQWLVPRVSAAVVGSFPLTTSMLALVWGSLFGRETLTVRWAAGAAMILTGVALVAFVRSPGTSPRAERS